ncbi:carbohydrate kinase family protein [Lysinibacter cavernae]|uniref:Fructokinase n=1 Tax=Lysinibacter cavernae TaxID=1640652 RepID=A0A7X5R057_9MICO|nr:carbohydrate kinase [Lysinibacter cavernae]NIH53156.1 fructokinase [Lysinibacter cavernae]
MSSNEHHTSTPAKNAASTDAHIMVAGEALIDLIGQRDGSYLPVAGGSALNVAVALAKLDAPVEFLTRLSNDAMSRPIRSKLEDNGVGLTHAVDVPNQTTLAVASLSESGSASYSFYVNGTADTTWESADQPSPEVSPVALHIGSFSLSLETGATILPDYAAKLYAAGRTTVTFDPNIRLGMGPTPEQEAARVLRQIPTTHIVKASDEDLESLYPDRSPEDVLRSFTAEFGVHAVLTRGANGVFSVRPNGTEFSVETRPAHPLIDTVGAGDTFWGGMLSQLFDRGALGGSAEQSPSERLAALSDDDWVESLRYAGTAASLVCERAGAQPPTRAEVAAAASD